MILNISEDWKWLESANKITQKVDSTLQKYQLQAIIHPENSISRKAEARKGTLDSAII